MSNNASVTKFEIKIDLPLIRPIKPELKTSRNINIGTFDIETFYDSIALVENDDDVFMFYFFILY